MTAPTGDAAFYDRIARRFGGYSSGVRPRLAFPGDRPEEVFRDLVLACARRAQRVLDVGSGDGRFTLSVARHAPVVVGIDIAELMLRAAEARRRAAGLANVHFVRQDAARMAFAEATFDVA